MNIERVLDIPDTYALLCGDDAADYSDGCAFVLTSDGSIVDAYSCGCAVPWLDAVVTHLEGF